MLAEFIKDYENIKGVKDSLACPICLEEFKVIGNVLPSGLSREHVPPHSLGGKVICYTCKECNNKAGFTIDGELLKGIQFNKNTFLHTMDGQRARVSRGDKTTQATISSVGGEMTLKHSKKNNHPGELEKFINEIKKGTKLNLKYILPDFNEHLFNVGLLKTAYLMVFDNLGFQIILDPNYDIVRNQLINFNQKIYPFRHTILKNAFNAGQEGVFIGVIDGKKVLVSVIKLSFRGHDHTFGVLLPHCNSSLMDFISYLSTLLSFKPDEIKNWHDFMIVKGYEDRLSCLFTPLSKV